MLSFERHQEFLGPRHHLGRQPCQLGHVHAVALVGAACFQAMEEDHLPPRLAHRDVVIPRVLQGLGELHQLVIVGGEHRLAPHPVVQVLAHRPGDRHPVVGRGATADLVQQHQALGGGVVKDGAGLAHLHHEGRLSAGQIVAGAHPGEEPVHHADLGRRAGDVAAELRHQHRDPDLPEDGALAGHVRSGHEQHPGRELELHVVRDEGLSRHPPLQHRVTAPGEHQVIPAGHLRAHIPVPLRHIRERGPDVEPSKGAGGPLQSSGGAPGRVTQHPEERRLPLADLLLGPEDLLLVALELGRDVALGAGQGLSPLIVGGDLVGVGAGDLEEIAEDLVIPDLERRDPGALPLPLLDAREGGLAAVAQVAQLVELGIVSGADGAAVDESGRGTVR